LVETQTRCGKNKLERRFGIQEPLKSSTLNFSFGDFSGILNNTPLNIIKNKLKKTSVFEIFNDTIYFKSTFKTKG